MKQKILIFITAAGLSFGYLFWVNQLSESAETQQPATSVSSDISSAPDEQPPSTKAASTSSVGKSGDGVKDRQVVGSLRPAAGESVERLEKQYPVRVYRPMAIPNDPMASQNWVTQTKISDVWSTPRPEVNTTLAIIDSGFAMNHEEFQGRWATNDLESGPTTEEAASAYNCSDRSLAMNASCNLIDDNRDGVVDNESGGVTYENPSKLNCSDQGRSLTKDCNLIDDDGNGYVDDHTGWDFINFDNSAQAGELNPSGTGTTHGTMVAGLAAATGNNGVGLAGVDWSTKILPLQALDDDEYGDTFSVGDAIYYAIERDVDVISLSLGSDLPDTYVQEAVEAASAKGITIVAASGNDGRDCVVYPAHYPEVLAVGALETDNSPASFSSYGSSLDIMAPGTGLKSTTWSSDNQTAAYVENIAGTSFATPIASGMIVRLLAQQPYASPQQLIAALTENTDRSMLGQTVARDNRWGFGRLNASSSSQRMINTPSEKLVHAFSPVHNGNYLNPSQPLEFDTKPLIHRCSDGRPGSTAIYNLTKTGSDFFTVSSIEDRLAIERGYTSKLFAYGCIKQPHDSPETVRMLNIFREFKNISQPR